MDRRRNHAGKYAGVNNRNRKRRRKRYKGVGRFVAICVVFVAIITGGFLFINAMGGNDYDDKDSFESFSNGVIKELGTSRDFGEEKIEYHYGEPVSVTQAFPNISNNDLNYKLSRYLGNLRDDFEGMYQNKDKKEKFARITGYETFESNRNTSSLVLKTIDYVQNKDGNMEIMGGDVMSYNFNSKNFSELFPSISFEPGYKEKLKSLIDNKLNSDYKDKLKSGYEKALDDSKLFERYSMDGNDLTFYFTPGQVLPAKDGIIEVKLDSGDLKGVVKDKINPRNIDPSKPMVAFTYDDGPSAETSLKLLDVLKKNDIVATFFDIGFNVENVKGGYDIEKQIEGAGNEIGSHSWNHPNMFTLSDAKVKEQNDKADAAFVKALGHKPTIYRPPYGNGNEKTTKIFDKAGILWSVDTLDWKSRNKDAIIKIVKGVQNLDGKVVLMHSIYQSSVDASAELIPYLKEKGYQFVTVSELLAYKYKEDPSQIKFYGYNYFYPKEQIPLN